MAGKKSADAAVVKASKQLHKETLAVVNGLIAINPKPKSRQGRALVLLAKAVERYEKVLWPFPKRKAGR
jgi:hypothetical protein